MAASNTKNNSPRKLTWTSPWRQQAQQAANQEPPPPPPADIAQSVNEEEQLADNATAGFVEESNNNNNQMANVRGNFITQVEKDDLLIPHPLFSHDIPSPNVITMAVTNNNKNKSPTPTLPEFKYTTSIPICK